MTFTELVEEVARRTVKTKESTKEVLKEAFGVIEEQVLNLNRDVVIIGFGKFSRRVVKGGMRKVGGQLHRVEGRDTLKFKSYAKKLTHE